MRPRSGSHWMPALPAGGPPRAFLGLRMLGKQQPRIKRKVVLFRANWSPSLARAHRSRPRGGLSVELTVGAWAQQVGMPRVSSCLPSARANAPHV